MALVCLLCTSTTDASVHSDTNEAAVIIPFLRQSDLYRCTFTIYRVRLEFFQFNKHRVTDAKSDETLHTFDFIYHAKKKRKKKKEQRRISFRRNVCDRLIRTTLRIYTRTSIYEITVT